MNNFIIRSVPVAVLLAACAAASAQSSLAAQATGPGFSLVSGTTPQTATVSGTGSYPLAPGATGSSAATAVAAGYGLVHATCADAQSGGWGDYFGTRSSASSSWYDDMIINPSNPLLIGTPGTFTVTLRVTGSLSAAFTGAGWTAADVPTAAGGVAMYVDSSFFMYTNDYVQAMGSGPQLVTQSVNRVEVVVVPFTFGMWFNLGINLNTISSITAGSPQGGVLSASTSASDWTCSWEGISGVMSADGPLGSDAFAMTSASGTDYTAAVPAPGAAAVATLGGLAAVRRRRR